MSRRLIAWLWLAGFCAGCASLNVDNRPLNDEILPLARPQGPARRIVQHIQASWGDRDKQFLVVMELDERRIVLAGLSAEGVSLFTIRYDGNTVTVDKSPLLADNLAPERVVNDVQRAFWPVAALRKIAPKHWMIDEDANRRRLYFQRRLVAEVIYSQNGVGGGRWPDTAVLIDHRYHYRLQIKTLSYESISQ